MRLDKSVVIKQVRLIDPLQNLDQVTDIWLDTGQIQAIGPDLAFPAATEIISGESWIVGPALIDLYAQSGEPGFEQRETLYSLSQAALAGGFTQVALVPTTTPALTHLDIIQTLQARQAPVQFLPLAAVTTDTDHLTELGELAQAQIAGFCALPPIQSPLLLQRVFEYLQPFNLPLLIWPWNLTLAQEGLIYEGTWALRLGLKSIPPTAETTQVAMILELLRRTPIPIHLMRISQARSVDLIAQAQQEQLPVSASTTWMHLVFADQDIQSLHYNSNLRLLPPLGHSANRTALQQALEKGILTAIATDHQPYTFEEKAVPFGDALPGTIGLELVLPILWERLVASGQLSALRLWSALSIGPASCLKLPLPSLKPGFPAQFTIFDPTYTWTVTRQTLQSKSLATPWLNQRIRGKVVACGHRVEMMKES